MVVARFKHYVLALSHRRDSLVILQTAVASAITLAIAGISLVYVIIVK